MILHPPGLKQGKPMTTLVAATADANPAPQPLPNPKRTCRTTAAASAAAASALMHPHPPGLKQGKPMTTLVAETADANPAPPPLPNFERARRTTAAVSELPCIFTVPGRVNMVLGQSYDKKHETSKLRARTRLLPKPRPGRLSDVIGPYTHELHGYYWLCVVASFASTVVVVSHFVSSLFERWHWSLFFVPVFLFAYLAECQMRYCVVEHGHLVVWQGTSRPRKIPLTNIRGVYLSVCRRRLHCCWSCRSYSMFGHEIDKYVMGGIPFGSAAANNIAITFKEVEQSFGGVFHCSPTVALVMTPRDPECFLKDLFDGDVVVAASAGSSRSADAV